MTRVAVALGASLGDRARSLLLAVHGIGHLGHDLVASRIVATPPVGGVARHGFYNAVVRLRTDRQPLDLLAALRGLEWRLGRRPTRHWADRVLDLDLLLFGDDVLDLDSLSVPHPRMHERRFVLQPLAEVWPEARDPRSGVLWRDLLRGPPHPVIGVLPRLQGREARCTPAPTRS